MRYLTSPAARYRLGCTLRAARYPGPTPETYRLPPQTTLRRSFRPEALDAWPVDSEPGVPLTWREYVIVGLWSAVIAAVAYIGLVLFVTVAS